jgi:hypothetical protein
MGLIEQVMGIVDSPYDIMLGKKWCNGVGAFFQWVQEDG